jgi:hypothetical protein
MPNKIIRPTFLINISYKYKKQTRRISVTKEIKHSRGISIIHKKASERMERR